MHPDCPVDIEFPFPASQEKICQIITLRVKFLNFRCLRQVLLNLSVWMLNFCLFNLFSLFMSNLKFYCTSWTVVRYEVYYLILNRGFTVWISIHRKYFLHCACPHLNITRINKCFLSKNGMHEKRSLFGIAWFLYRISSLIFVGV